MTDEKRPTDALAKAVYAVIRELRNPFGKMWDELTEHEKDESRRLAMAALKSETTPTTDETRVYERVPLCPHWEGNAVKISTAAKSRWNAQADAYNQWDSLGQDEKDALIAKEADDQRASQCPAAEAPRE